jgi:hypothetical protein
MGDCGAYIGAASERQAIKPNAAQRHRVGCGAKPYRNFTMMNLV